MAPRVHEFLVLQEDPTFKAYLEYLKAVQEIQIEMLLRCPDVNRTDPSNWLRGKIDVIKEILELPDKFQKEIIRKKEEDEKNKGKGV